MERAHIFDVLSRVFSDVFLRDDIVLSDELTAHDVDGWDSFKNVEILMAAEEAFGMKFTSAELDSLTRLGDLIDVVEQRGRLAYLIGIRNRQGQRKGVEE